MSKTRVVALAATLFVVLLATASTASAWAPADSATVRPGVQTITAGAGQCTANFVFSDGATTYIGQAAHCSGTGAANETDGCLAGSLPLGTQVEIEDYQNPGTFPVRGTMVYNSWLEMQADGETDANTCAKNDFALIRLDNAGVAQTNPTVPFWGGPTGINGTLGNGANVYSYGNSSLRFGIEQLKPKRGVSVQQGWGGWSYDVYTVTPGIPGDSGSAFLDGQGRAIGVLSTLAIAPLPASNGVSDLSRMLAYMRSHNASFAGVNLVNGTSRSTAVASSGRPSQEVDGSRRPSRGAGSPPDGLADATSIAFTIVRRPASTIRPPAIRRPVLRRPPGPSRRAAGRVPRLGYSCPPPPRCTAATGPVRSRTWSVRSTSSAPCATPSSRGRSTTPTCSWARGGPARRRWRRSSPRA